MRLLPSLWNELDRPFASMLRELNRPSLANWVMPRQIDEWFSDVLPSSSMLEEIRFAVPACNIEETDEHYILSFDMPGVEKENIDVELKGNQLMVTGEQKQVREQTEGKLRYAERRLGKFERFMSLPNDIKPDQVEADFRNGVLTVAVAKTPESKKQKIRISEEKTGFLNKFLGESHKKDKKTIDVKASAPV